MASPSPTVFSILAALAGLACGPAHAERAYVAKPYDGVLMPSTQAQSPYRVELVSGYGATLPTYESRGRYYVLGDHGDRYSIRVHNPTGQRVEAVVSVDGLDVIDGETAGTGKRGYVVQPYDSITIEGFRTSTSQVATFRFSSVGASYAGRKGQARNVGVIGVAIYEEKAAPVAVPLPVPHPHPYPHPRERGPGDWHAKSGRAPASSDDRVGSAEARPAPARRPASPTEESVAGAPLRDEAPCWGCETRPQRPGLGTEFGEGRYSAVTWTRFERRSSQPDAMATLRYNDANGLAALGIRIHHPYDDEVAIRETADPFPGRFAAPPP